MTTRPEVHDLGKKHVDPERNRCGVLFIATDGLMHLCDISKNQPHPERHRCNLHSVEEPFVAS